ncbi:MAG TPA: glycoside hydrolase family 3 N-terminal domain-containing protein [Chitinophagales bacterium]|nr:glycoside hydrolase family 3 N-terminal domain-containing protein [Chitinophagales bacterium]
MRFFLLTICVLAVSVGLSAQDIIQMSIERMQYLKSRDRWVDSIFSRLTDEERIAQLFMVAAYSNRDEKHKAEMDSLIRKYGIGGLIFFQGTPYKQAQLTNYYQSISKVPLLIAIDAEWGLAMRLDSTIAFPHQLTLGAHTDTRLIYEMGKDIARQCKRLGIHVNFAPVADINSNPSNPVINDRSFGEDKLSVSLKALAYMEGLQSEGVMACAKHFPGHGDTDSDSHLTLPVIYSDRKRLDEMELYPFKVLINNGVQSIMAAHLFIPQLDSTPNLASSLSPRVVTDLLRMEIGFNGIVFSDALNMKGVSSFFRPGEVDLKAFQAGNDVMLFAGDVPRAVRMFLGALKDSVIQRDDLYRRVKKILYAKFDAGLSKYHPIALQHLTQELNQPASQWLRQRLFEDAMTLLANKDSLIPFLKLDTLTFGSVSIGAKQQTPFQAMLGNYAPFEHFQIRKDAAPQEFENLLVKLAKFKLVVAGIHDMNRHPNKNFGITDASLEFLKQLSERTKVAVTVFGNPYSLKHFEDFDWLLEAYEEQDAAQQVAAQVLFGGISAKGQLPVTASEKFKAGMGLTTPSPIRLKYTFPEETGIPSQYLTTVDSIASAAIRDKATPGCQILIAKDGRVIYYKAFGYYTYDSAIPVKTTDLYDIASITKIAATTLSLMRLYDERKFQLNRTLGDYLTILDSSPLKSLMTKDVLLHQARLRSWIPFYQTTIADSVYAKFYQKEKKEPYIIEVAKDMFMRKDGTDSIYFQIINSKLNPKKEYLYSDLGFYLFKQIVEKLSGRTFEDYTAKTFYQPLGLSTMTFKPLEKFPRERIVPTEDDKTFRKQLLQGYVHDPGAAMLGGVSGHAGLFSNANDLAILMQMLLNRGEYAGVRYFSPTTVSLFTRKQEENNRRGLGFDKPELDPYKLKSTATDASPRTFGHSGFTGTCVWADPDYNLIYVFLSNRVHPTADNQKLIQKNIRTQIHQAIYDALKKSGNSALTKGN